MPLLAICNFCFAELWGISAINNFVARELLRSSRSIAAFLKNIKNRAQAPFEADLDKKIIGFAASI